MILVFAGEDANCMLARGLEFVMEAIDSIYNTKGRKVAPMQCEPCLYFGGFTPISRPDTLSGKRELNVQEMIGEFEDAEKRGDKNDI